MCGDMPTMTVAELIEKCRHAAQRMSRTNPHRLLLVQVEHALIQLATMVAGEQTPPEVMHAPDNHT